MKQSNESCLRASMTVCRSFNYADHQNGRCPVLKDLKICNSGDAKLTELVVRVSTAPAFARPRSFSIDTLPPDGTVRIPDCDIIPDPAFLATLEERVEGAVTVEILQGNALLYTDSAAVSVQAYNEWSGDPQTLPAFVMPNHPAVQRIMEKTAARLAEKSGSPAQKGYQGDRAYVERVLGVLYEVMQQLELGYCIGQASFEHGQKIRLPGQVLAHQMGNCMDLTVLTAACMEQLGLHPVLIGIRGHIFAGCWLQRKTFPEAVIRDVSVLRQLIDAGELLPMECTMFAKSASTVDFRHACDKAAGNLETFTYAVDVKRARMAGVRPLPAALRNDDGTYCFVEPEEAGEELPEDDIPAPRPEEYGSDREFILAQWSHQLLSAATARNSLVNVNSRNSIPVFCGDPDELLHALEDGVQLLPAEAELAGRGPEFEKLAPTAADRALIERALGQRRLFASAKKGELQKSAGNLLRAAKASFTENSVNPLYLGLGILRYYDEAPDGTADAGKQELRHAPLILCPIEMTLSGGIRIVASGEPELNEALLERLRRTAGLNLCLGDSQPGAQTIRQLRRAIVGRRDWLVLDCACVSDLLVNDYVLWREFRDHRDEISAHRVVASRLNGTLQWDACDVDRDEELKSASDVLLLPFELDPSQQEAVRAADVGRDFVIWGPPGGGKTQTNASIIANAIAKGKKVLFVSEKVSAREDVQKHLNEIGLSPFLLSLTYGRTSRADVVGQLESALGVKRSGSTGYCKQAEALEKETNAFHSYYQSLFSRRKCGMSLYELIMNYEDVHSERSYKAELLPPPEKLTPEVLAQHERLVRALTEMGEQIHPGSHPLRALRQTEYSRENRTMLEQQLRRFVGLSTQCREKGRALQAALELTAEEMEKLPALRTAVMAWDEPECDFEACPAAEYYAQMQDMAALAAHVRRLRKKLSLRWNDEFFALDASALLDQRTEGLAWLRARMKLFKLIEGMSARPLTYDDAIPELQKLRELQACEQKLDELWELHAESLGLEDMEAVDWEQVEVLCQRLGDGLRKVYDVLGEERGGALLENEAEVMEYLHLCDELAQLRQAIPAELPDDPQKAQAFCTRLYANLERLEEWCAWNRLAKQAREAGLSAVVRSVYKGLIDAETIRGAYRQGICKVLIDDALGKDPALRGFNSLLFDTANRELGDRRASLRAMAAAEIRHRLAQSLPNLTEGSRHSADMGLLGKWMTNPRIMSIRRAFERLGELITAICPCVMVSPESAAQFLPFRAESFDYVIFDEASQLTMARALGTIARGKHLIVCGDPKQMPPTSFFRAMPVTDERYLEIADLESVLDECIGMNMPAVRLRYHYRSRHEDLIAFSNRRFYDGKLVTFPAVTDTASHVKLVPVQGVLRRSGSTRCNVEEAAAIVDELKRRAKDSAYRDQSVGIITFNIHQQAVIRQMLEAACAEDAELSRWLYAGRELVFIKNLENCQGDERDLILLSVTFGPDEDGKTSLNFGPLNKDRGWRRLNVAISRAREEMLVFSSLDPAKITEDKTTAEGALALRDFLRYARDPQTLDRGPECRGGQPVNKIASAIRACLEENGYEVHANLGTSELRLELAVVDQAHPERYALGILVDDPLDQTLDRDSLQRRLESKGWKILRIRALDWFDHRSYLLRTILETLAKA